jgi:hypothetical protein
VRSFWLALLVCIAWMPPCDADQRDYPSLRRLLPLDYDWQGPAELPRRYRNHCSFDVTHGRYYCSNHCGFDYQFYYCSQGSFGCCRIGVGYCGWDGLLRCRP